MSFLQAEVPKAYKMGYTIPYTNNRRFALFQILHFLHVDEVTFTAVIPLQYEQQPKETKKAIEM